MSYFWLKVTQRHEVWAKVTSVSSIDSWPLPKGFEGFLPEALNTLILSLPVGWNWNAIYFLKTNSEGTPQNTLFNTWRCCEPLCFHAIQGLSGHTQVYSNLHFPASFSHLMFCVRDPQSHPPAQKLLEGLTRLRKVVTFVFVVYYSKGTQINISKGERYTGQSPRETRCKPDVPSQGSLMGAHAALPATMCDNTCCPSESSLGISVQCFC